MPGGLCLLPALRPWLPGRSGYPGEPYYLWVDWFNILGLGTNVPFETSGNRTPIHIEGIDAPAPGAPGATPETLSSPLVVEFQLRPDPLAH